MARVAAMPTPPPSPSVGPPGIITIPLLVSGIGNMVGAVFWLCTCFLFFLAAPLIILGVFEFLNYSKINNRQVFASQSSIRTLAILEIVAGLINLIALVCGIIILVNIGRVDLNAWKGLPPQARQAT
jgi:hypothetical protein